MNLSSCIPPAALKVLLLPFDKVPFTDIDIFINSEESPILIVDIKSPLLNTFSPRKSSTVSEPPCSTAPKDTLICFPISFLFEFIRAPTPYIATASKKDPNAFA